MKTQSSPLPKDRMSKPKRPLAKTNGAPDFRKQNAAANEQARIDEMKRKYETARAVALISDETLPGGTVIEE